MTSGGSGQEKKATAPFKQFRIDVSGAFFIAPLRSLFQKELDLAVSKWLNNPHEYGGRSAMSRPAMKKEKELSLRKYRLSATALISSLVFIVLAAFILGRYSGEAKLVQVSPFMIIPFILLLISIAIMPFVNPHWWERKYPYVALGLAGVAIFYYVFILQNGTRIIYSANEYFSFIALIGSLFVVSGGIHISVKGRATPLANVLLLSIGAVAANFLGTTGASMMLIRPYMRVNKYRISGYHIVFFIFVVSNIGGMLTPIGDPPLFLGYLKGIPFFWVITKIWPIWILATGIIISIFYFIDWHNFKKLPDPLEHEIEEKGEQFSVTGLSNCILLAAIIAAVFLPRPMREIVMICAALASVMTTHLHLHDKNEFNLIPLKEVVILFAGIFATMTPAMDWLELNAVALGISHPGQFYWGSGILSSFLDNAPTYLNFLSAACGLHGLNVDNPLHVKALLGLVSHDSINGLAATAKTGIIGLTADTWRYILAISAGSVMFGAATYIGNGPNFMVKSIAEQSHIKMPSFFGFIAKYSIPVLGPVLILIWFLFFR
jgi:Na+/H+ antiporter NhaD/arsenite permease-like protein